MQYLGKHVLQFLTFGDEKTVIHVEAAMILAKFAAQQKQRERTTGTVIQGEHRVFKNSKTVNESFSSICNLFCILNN